MGDVQRASAGHDSQPLVPSFSEAFMGHVKQMQQSLLPSDKPASDALAAFLKDVQHAGNKEQTDSLAAVQDASGLQLLLTYLASRHADALAPAPEYDLTKPMSQYFISSSHNTYLTGNQLYSDSSVDGYKSVLLNRCRCVEIDVWDGRPHEGGKSDHSEGEHHSLREKFGFHRKQPEAPPPAKEEIDPMQPPSPWKAPGSMVTEPRVLHGYTFTKEVSFRKVCEAIRDTAFVNSDLPLIVSLEVHTSHEQQEMMVDIMRNTWNEFLLDHTHRSDVAMLPAPDKLRRKILIKVKYTPPEKKKKQQQAGSIDSDSDEEEANHQGSPGKQQQKKPKKKKIIDELSELGVYTRSCHFSGFEQPEAKLPTHVFAVSENRIMQAIQMHRHKLFAHNKNYFMRAYPKGLRVASTNLNPIPMWRQGVQLVALNWQKGDGACMINQAMFAGTGGWVLKPDLYRSTEAPSAEEMSRSTTIGSELSLTHTNTQDGVSRQSLDIKIKIYAAQGLSGLSKHSHPYVKVILHTNSLAAERSGDSSSSTSRSRSRSSSPQREGRRVSKTERASSLLRGHRASSTSDTTKKGAEPSQQTPKTKIKARTSTGRGAEPDFHGETLKFTHIPVEDASLAFLRLKVMNTMEIRRDELAAWACFRLERLRHGVRVVRLFNKDWTAGDGRLLVDVEWSFKENPVRSGALPVRSKAG